MWKLENYPVHSQFGDPPGGVIATGAFNRVVVDPDNPTYLPHRHLLDLRLEKAFKLGGEERKLRLVVDGFNVFNTSAPTDIVISEGGFGKVTAIPSPRRFRGGIRYEF
jgi:hypothetical protein